MQETFKFCYLYELINGVYLYHALYLTHHNMHFATQTPLCSSMLTLIAFTTFSFLPHVTSLWNTLPNAVTSESPIHVFKNLIS